MFFIGSQITYPTGKWGQDRETGHCNATNMVQYSYIQLELLNRDPTKKCRRKKKTWGMIKALYSLS